MGTLRLAFAAFLLALTAGLAAAAPSSDEEFKSSLQEVRGTVRKQTAHAKKAVRQSGKAKGGGRQETFRIISWNIQVFGSSISGAREQGYASILKHMFSDTRTAQVLAIQEIAHDKGAANFERMLPGAKTKWNLSFEDSPDSMDNGFYATKDVHIHCQRSLFDRSKSMHPARIAHMHVGDFDFTIITLHLTFHGGKSDHTVRELEHIGAFLKLYLSKPENDPDVVITGDFNLSSRKGKPLSIRASEKAWLPIEDVLERETLVRWERRDGTLVQRPVKMHVLVDERSSRQKGAPANNYDHFILTDDVYDEEYVQGSAGVIPPNYIHAVEKDKGAVLSDHYPISAGFVHTGAGNDGRKVALDRGCPCDDGAGAPAPAR